MQTNDKRIIWKEMNDFQLLGIIQEFINKNEIQLVRQYQSKLNEQPHTVSSTWFINTRFKSWYTNTWKKALRKIPMVCI